MTLITTQAEIDMALMGCAESPGAVRVRPVKNTPWQARLKAAGLTQKRLAAWLGVSENTISRQMKGEWPVAGYVLAAVAAWEVMDEPTREAWIRRIEEG